MDKSLEKRIGAAAREARVSLGMTQEDAAEQIGVSVEFYSRIERGTALPSLRTFICMALTFGKSTDHLLGLTDKDDVQQLILELSPPLPDDLPEIKRMMRRLRNTTEENVRTVHDVSMTVLNAIEKAAAGAAPKKTRKRRSRKKARDDTKG